MNAFHKMTLLVVAWLGIHAAAHADLYPGSQPMGWGNIRGGTPSANEPDAFYRDVGFYIGWGNSPVATSERFTDISGAVGSVARFGSLSPYEFTGVELYSLGTGSLLSSYSFAPGSDQGTFTFERLLEGAYSIRFLGKSIPSPDGWWPVNEWQYSFGAQASAVASPAPEASQLAMSVVGLAAVVAWARRKRQPRSVA